MCEPNHSRYSVYTRTPKRTGEALKRGGYWWLRRSATWHDGVSNRLRQGRHRQITLLTQRYGRYLGRPARISLVRGKRRHTRLSKLLLNGGDPPPYIHQFDPDRGLIF